MLAHEEDREIGINTAAAHRPLFAGLRSDSVVERNRAWRELYAVHADKVYRLVCCLGVPGGEVEDAVQHVFTIAHRRLDEVEVAPDKIGAWLRGIAVRVAADQRRFFKLRRVKQWFVRSTAEAEAPPVPTPEQRVDQAQTAARTQAVLAELSPKLREVLVLAELEQCKPAEVAELLGIPVNTARSRKRIARERFIELWQQASLEQEDADA